MLTKRHRLLAVTFCLLGVLTHAQTPLDQSTNAPHITLQPSSIAVNEGNTAYFHVYATSTVSPLFVRWRHNGGFLSGENSWTLELEEIGPDAAGDYDAVITNPFGSVTSEAARLTVVPAAPRFTLFSAGGTVYLGGWLTLVSYAKGTQPMSFQWFKDDALLSGAINAEYRTTNVVATDTGDYFLIASNSVGSATSLVARVTVKALEAKGPNDLSVLLGARAELAAMVSSGVPVSIQWYHQNESVSGGTNQHLVFTSAQLADAGSYFVIASNQFTNVTSRVATFSVLTQAPGVSVYVTQSSAGSSNISNPPGGIRVPIGGSVAFSGNASGGPPPALQWQRNGTDLSGQTNIYLRLANLTTNDAGLYEVLATNIVGATTSAPIRLEVVTLAPVFTMIPGNRSVVAGSTVTLHGYVAGGPPPTVQWRLNGRDLPGQTNFSLVRQNVSTDDHGTYELAALNDSGQASVSALLDVRHATGLDLWQWRNPLPQGNRLKSVAWGNGRWVAVGNASSLLTSTNGADWTSIGLDAYTDFDTVAFGNGVFVAAGQTIVSSLTRNYVYEVNGVAGVVFVSSDGIHWTAGRCPDFDALPDIAFGDGVFVAGSTWGRTFLYTSVDGLNWTPQSGDVSDSARRVAWGNGKFLAATYQAIFQSPNARQWNLTTNASDFLNVTGMAYHDGHYVVVGADGAILVSTNGESWAMVTNYYNGLRDVTAGPDGFVAPASSAKRLLTSPDGLAWTEVNPKLGDEFEAAAFGGGQYGVVGEGGTVITSPNGATWSTNLVGNQVNLYGLAQSDHRLVAVGEEGTILTSPDGRDWTPRPSTTGRDLHAVHYADGLFVATGKNGTILTSADGLTWAQRNSGSANYLERVTWANGLWVVVGESGDLCTSTNGLDWSVLNTGYPLADHEGIAYGNGVWVAAGGYFFNGTGTAHSTIYYSTNGTQWLPAVFDLGVRLRDVTFGAGRFLVVGNDGFIGASTDGIFWTSGGQVGFSNFRRAHFARGNLVLVGNDGMMFSTPASANYLQASPPAMDLFLDLSWTENRSRTTQNLHDVFAAQDGVFYAVGNNGMLLQSGQTRPRLTGFSLASDALGLNYDPGIVPAINLSLEASTDLRSWQTVATNVTVPIVIPTTNDTGHFFRLVAP